MPLYALEDLDDAWDATRSFLWPVDRSRWLRLALVVLFIGGPGANLNLFQWNVPSEGTMPVGQLPTVGPRFWAIIAVLVAVILLFGLVFLLVGSVMNFVLVESLRHETVAVREYWGRRWGQGLRLFGFRIVIGLLVFGSAAVFAALFFIPIAVERGTGAVAAPGAISAAALVLLVPVIIALAILVGLVNGFTTVFVVPIMVLEDCGVLAGWRRLWPTITAHPWQYLTYAIAGFLLSILAGIFVAIVIAISAIILLIPFGILGVVGFVLLVTVPPLGVGVLALVGLLFVLSIIVVAAVIQVPVMAYLRYYALLVLGDVDAELDLIPDRRAAIRTESEAGDGGAAS